MGHLVVTPCYNRPSHDGLVEHFLVGEAVQADELHRARQLWRTIALMIAPLFAEANPMPLKHCLWRLGLIRSPECRLPLTRGATRLAERLDAIVSRLVRTGLLRGQS